MNTQIMLQPATDQGAIEAEKNRRLDVVRELLRRHRRAMRTRCDAEYEERQCWFALKEHVAQYVYLDESTAWLEIDNLIAEITGEKVTYHERIDVGRGLHEDPV